MTLEDILRVLDDESMRPIDVTRQLGSWAGREFDLRLDNWTFHDFRPRDEWFSIHSQVTGRAYSLQLLVQDGGKLDATKKMHLFEIGNRDQRSPIRVRAVVPDACSTLSTGLFFDILDYSVEDTI